MRIHLIAIGGAIMHNLALELKHIGHEVSGSDDMIYEPAKSRLKIAGLLPEKQGWFPEKITPKLDLIILGMHAKADNPELLEAQRLNLNIQSFPEFIYHHSKNKKRLVIGGSHGKTTTTAMVMHALLHAGKEFDYLVGSQLDGFERMVKLSDADLIVIEGDEYLTSPMDLRPKFLHYKPAAAVITGIAWDHINVFPNYDDYVEQFNLFAASSEKVFVQESIKQETKFIQNLVTEWYAHFDYEENKHTAVIHEGKKYPMKVFGKFNFENMKASSLLCREAGINIPEFLTSMQEFSGTSKRQEVIYKDENKTLIRDFAHAPSKVKATVEAVREKFKDKNFLALLELHTFSSLSDEFIPFYANCLSPADAAIVFVDRLVLENKNKPLPKLALLEKAFPNATIVFEKAQLKHAFESHCKKHPAGVRLLMSSGALGEIDFKSLV
jgi:UDP-N-acetylmuramate: L-alanyl-gamma-D-glutamyl-meso-diaminopimelate ligase